MASELLQLRKRAGYRSARDFAEHIDIPLPTYSRYEANPDKIPLKAAWQIADSLNCSIDVVVGRRPANDVEAFKGDVQREYDALSDEGKELMDELRGYVRYKERENRQRKLFAERKRYDLLCAQYERLMFQEQEEKTGFGDLVAFGSPEEQRKRFEAFITKKAEDKRKSEEGDPQELAERDEDTISKIMEAFDRQHIMEQAHSEGVSVQELRNRRYMERRRRESQ